MIKEMVCALSLLVFFGCAGEEIKSSKRVESKERELILDPEEESTTNAEEISYREDILPILSSNVKGKIYKCTVCHSWMFQNEPSKEQAQSIMESIEQEAMPPEGEFDSLALEDKKLLKLWFQSNYTSE